VKYKITSIKQQQKLKDRVSVFVDGKYSFSLSRNELQDQRLYTGQEFTKTRLDELKDLSSLDKVYNRALRFIEYRPRSVKEVVVKLRQLKVEKESVAKVVNKLLSQKFLDDRKFAQLWVEHRRGSSPRGSFLIGRELHVKGIDQKIIDDVLEIKPEDELELAIELAQKKMRTTEDPQKILAFLARRGFRYDISKGALEKAKSLQTTNQG